MQHYTAEQTAARLVCPALIATLRRCFQQSGETPLRHIHSLANRDEADTLLLLKPAKNAQYASSNSSPSPPITASAICPPSTAATSYSHAKTGKSSP